MAVGNKESPPVPSPVPWPEVAAGWPREQRRRKRRVRVLSRKEGSSDRLCRFLGGKGEFLGAGGGCWVPRASLARASARGSSGPGAGRRQQPWPEPALPGRCPSHRVSPCHRVCRRPSPDQSWGITPGRCRLQAGGCTWGCSQAEKQPLSCGERFLNYFFYFPQTNGAL